MVLLHAETVLMWWRGCRNQQDKSLEMRPWGSGGCCLCFTFVFLTVKLTEIDDYLNWDMVWDVLGRRGASVRDGLRYKAALLPWFSNETLISH